MLWLEIYLAFGLIVFLCRLWVERRISKDFLEVALGFVLLVFLWLPSLLVLAFFVIKKTISGDKDKDDESQEFQI